MSFKKREPKAIIQKATTRQAGMAQIETNQGNTIDYGGDVRGALTASTVQAKLISYANELRSYNQLLQQADSAGNTLAALETEIASDYTVVLKSAVAKFGENSSEVEMLSRKKKTEQKKRIPKPALKTA